MTCFMGSAAAAPLMFSLPSFALDMKCDLHQSRNRAQRSTIAVNIIDSRRHAIGNALRERAYGARRIHSQGPGDDGSIGDV